MSLQDILAEKERYTDYADGLQSSEKEEVRAYLKAIFANHEKVESQLLVRFPEEQVTRHYLEALFPDESTAIAYLSALKGGNTKIMEIEGAKEAATRNLRSPLTKRHRKHLQVLELAWGLQDGSVDGRQLRSEIEYLCHGAEEPNSEAQSIFNTWLEAEITRIKMRNFIKGLDLKRILSREDLTRRTYLYKCKVSMRTWIIAAALVAQSRQSPTAKLLVPLLPAINRTTPTRMLNAIREAMVHHVDLLEDNMNWEIIDFDNLVNGCRLTYQYYGYWHNSRHRCDLMLKRIGQMRVEPLPAILRNGDANTPFVRKDDNDPNTMIYDSFTKWKKPHRRPNCIKGNASLLSEFVFRYNGDKEGLLGWGLINKLLRALLLNPEENPF